MHSIFTLFPLAIFTLVSIFMLYAAVISIYERAYRAATISATIFVLMAIVTYITSLELTIFNIDLTLIFSVLILFCGGTLLINPLSKFPIPDEKCQIDERDTMFSRSELTAGEENYQNYYTENPDKKTEDDAIRANPGLLSKGSLFYSPKAFAASNATFHTISYLHAATHVKAQKEQINMSADEATEYISGILKYYGALATGVTELQPHHFYSVKGRGISYGKHVENRHTHAIVFTVEMRKEMMDCAPKAPVVLESSRAYLSSGVIAVELAETIRQLGYNATAHIDGKYELVCPTIAADAGLGEVGRMGLLITPTHGPRVRIAVVTTDLPLNPTPRKVDKSVYDFCNRCSKCVEVCPSQSISPKRYDPKSHWKINQESCFKYWTKIGTDCGRCMRLCPYSHPHNFFHSVIRFGIKHSLLIRANAAKMDDLFYGKNPKAYTFPKWLK